MSVLDKLDMRPLTKAESARRRLAVTKGAAALVDKERLDWLSEDAETSNLYLVWQCMVSHEPGDLRQVIDMLRKKKESK